MAWIIKKKEIFFEVIVTKNLTKPKNVFFMKYTVAIYAFLVHTVFF